MISVEKAFELVHNHTNIAQKTIVLPIAEALGFVLSKDVVSPIHMPPFRQSAMDGYALGSLEEQTYTLVGEVQAGAHTDPKLQKGEAIRIFTGAPVPSTAKAVIMQEKVEVLNTQIRVQESPKNNANIRPLGEQIQKNDIALHEGLLLTASGIGYLASLGVTHIEVYQKPTIAIIATGNELVPPGQELKYGQIYESNSIMLSAALQNSGFTDITCLKVEDDYMATKTMLEQVIQQYDVVLISGGISVGDYDFVGKALRDLGVEEIFYKVKQKPGKPLFFAKKEKTTIFALPGNPASSLSCFYIYVLPVLRKISGYGDHEITRNTAIATSSYSKKGERAEFLKAIVKNGHVTILDAQASSMLKSFALANALAYLPEDVSEIQVGDTIQIIDLP